MNFFATINGPDVLQVVIWVVVVGLIYWLLTWLLGVCELPEPLDKVVRIVLAAAVVLFLINVLLGLAGHPVVRA